MMVHNSVKKSDRPNNRRSFRLSSFFILIAMIAVSLGVYCQYQRSVQVFNYWKSTLESAGCRLSIREADNGMGGWGLQLYEVTGVCANNWSPENEQKVVDGLNALGTVTHLSVEGQGFSENFLKRLQDVPRLQELSFRNVGVRDFDTLPPSVRSSVRALLIEDGGSNIKSVAAVGDCRQLNELHLGSLTFNSHCVWAKQLTDLETISLHESTGVSNIIPCLRSPRLRNFHADNSDLQDASLAKVARFPKLRMCFIVDTPITDRGLEYLRGHASLEYLDVSHTNITDESINLFESLPSLKDLGLRGTKVSQKAIDEFQSRHPEVTIID